jgi:hypothetical protein
MVANRLAVDGRSWANIFSMFNSGNVEQILQIGIIIFPYLCYIGTYNNQFMIIDLNKFNPLSKLSNQRKNWLLTVLEQVKKRMMFCLFPFFVEYICIFNKSFSQLPGHVTYQDMTEHLYSASYWASYNRPFFHSTWVLSNQTAWVAAYGDHYSHERTARAILMRSLHESVHDISSMEKVMRYNNFEQDDIAAQGC